MSKKRIALFLALMLMAAPSALAQPYQDGVYRDLALKWLGRGTEGKPVRIEAATPGGVEITGGSTLRLAGE